MRRPALLCLVLCTACGEGPPPTAERVGEVSASVELFAPPTAPEIGFLDHINAERAAANLPPLAPYWDLIDDARAHSDAMRQSGGIYHNPSLSQVTVGWQALGENVGVGPTVDSLHQAFMNSPAHAANVLGNYDYAGVGVVTDPTMWVTVVFMRHEDAALDQTLPPFHDDDHHWAEAAIHTIYEAGITVGCSQSPLRYCPEEPVTRAQMATFLVRALGLTPLSSDRFEDDDGHWAEKNIEALAEAGITVGCNAAGDRFCPEDHVTRAQMATFLARALSLQPSNANRFVDDDGHWAEKNIDAIANLGITVGCNSAGDRFCPEDDVTRAQMAAFLKRSFL